ncbi:MAG: serine/threonine-protein kinase [Myxococcota bacterium]
MAGQQQFPARFGEFTLLRRIAQGGMAEIFLAQKKDGQICALKRILPHLAHEEGFIRMFIDEARIVENLDHSNVARVLEQGKIDGYYFLAMEYVEGHSLLALSDRARSMKIALPRGLLAFVVGELLAGLGHAHSARDRKGRHLEVVHRDVTPQNVMISYSGEVKLIDFGVAKARARLTQTEAGFTKGKLSYMSPEQARGEELDGRSDLFSVGIILYEITTGSRLFNKEGPGGILSAIVNDPIPPPSAKSKEYPRDLEAIVMRALEKETSRRWQTAEDMRDALVRFAGREKPKPSRARLADLVHDLFGEPELRKVIEEAQAVMEPTPAGPVKAELVRGASSFKIGKEQISADEETKQPPPGKPDETRMLSLSEEQRAYSVKAPKLEVTSERLPALSIPIQEDEVPVPEPAVPFRVRFAEGLASFGRDARASWLQHKKRYIAGISVISVLLLSGVAYALGLPDWVSNKAGNAADRARELRRSAGLDPGVVDAGLMPTVLVVASEPPGANVSIDGVGAGCVTPCELTKLTFDRPISIELVLDGYRSRKEGLTLYANEGRREVSVSLDRAVGSVLIETEPAGAAITMNGTKLSGLSPLTIDNLKAGTKLKLEARKRGYLAKRWEVVPEDGDVTRTSVELELDQGAIPPGRLDIRSAPAGCAATVDGQSAGQTPVGDFEVRAGSHKVSVSCQYYAVETRTVDVEPGKTVKVALEPEANVFGYVSVSVKPLNGTVVTINGRKFTPPVEFAKVVPGRHVIEVKNASLSRQKTVTIDVAPDKRIARDIDLFQ